MASKWNVGKQPCGEFKQHEYAEFGMPTHQCQVCGNGQVAFCGNCLTDHHENGWEKCHEIMRKENAARE